MTDRISPENRSRLMSRIKGKDTKPEMIVRRWLHANGYRFRLHRRDLPGTPDIVLPKWRLAIFVHGCFWHRHEGCPKATMPDTHREFWEEKFRRNVERDRESRARLREMGWNVIVVWECETNREDRLALIFGGALGRGDEGRRSRPRGMG